MQKLDKDFWNQRWQQGLTGWDIGYASPAITDYFDHILDKNVSILIPGCGNAHEAEALNKMGFKSITVLDISDEAVKRLQEKFKENKDIEIICGDFFKHSNRYDYIVEQTFFCAIDPSLRTSYVDKMHSLLKHDGILTGLLFNRHFQNPGPPFGGTTDEYKKLFTQKFQFLQFQEANNSISARLGFEIFIEFQRK